MDPGNTAGVESMATLACFPADPEFAEALVEAFSERSSLIRAQYDMGGYLRVQLPVGLGISWVRCVLCPEAVLRTRRHSLLVRYLLVRLEAL